MEEEKKTTENSKDEQGQAEGVSQAELVKEVPEQTIPPYQVTQGR